MVCYIRKMTTYTSVLLGILTTFLVHPTSSSSCEHYDSESYTSKFKPFDCPQNCKITPFFSPDYSVTVYSSLIESAEETIDIYTPEFSSWNSPSCTKNCHGCAGCSLQEQKEENFPVFTALLNALHQRNVSIRIIINNCTASTCANKIAPLDWLKLNGIQVRLYKTTLFMHSKYMMIDGGEKTCVSSVNFSKTSFLCNREAGVVIEGCSCTDFYQKVFESDWEQSVEYEVRNTYTTEQMKFITDPAELNYNFSALPLLGHINGTFVTPLESYEDVKTMLYAGPDYSLDTLMSGLEETKHSLQVMIYEITNSAICNETLKLHQKGVNVSLLVSSRVVETKVSENKCYKYLYSNGIHSIRTTTNLFEFSHQKFWIIDNKTVHLSTGNWAVSDFPNGKVFKRVNRDLQVVMTSPAVVQGFQSVFREDWDRGTDWEPK